MGLLDKIRRKKKEETKPNIASTKTITELEQICGDDKETYRALSNTMFLDPRKIGTSMKEAAENAKQFEREKDWVRAKTWYEVAGALAIYEANAKKVIEFFTQCEKISPEREYPILKNPEKAVEKAREYYKKHLQV